MWFAEGLQVGRDSLERSTRKKNFKVYCFLFIIYLFLFRKPIISIETVLKKSHRIGIHTEKKKQQIYRLVDCNDKYSQL